ncbi:hypothetical protein, partial [Methylosinus sp. RM1]|uniref:hypothetical protein n=1 Tax=Methylosinus sp. RM1 TaxID=2583817 RepID=UPI00140D53D4
MKLTRLALAWFRLLRLARRHIARIGRRLVLDDVGSRRDSAGEKRTIETALFDLGAFSRERVEMRFEIDAALGKKLGHRYQAVFEQQDLRLGPLLELVVENGFDRAVGLRADLYGAFRRGLDALGSIGAGQA